MPEVVVCCVKWGTRYPALYVNRLHRMVARHLVRLHRFVCLTDDPNGLDPGIETIALPADLPGYWNKLSLFKAGLLPAGATIIYLDLDVVIVGSIDFLLDDPGGLVVIREWGTVSGAFNSSVMRFEAGRHPFIFNRFYPWAAEIISSSRYIGDQDWIAEQVPEAKSFPKGKIVSYKRDLRSHALPFAKSLRLDFLVKAPRFMTVSPPSEAAIVVFHGKPDPEDVMESSYGPWKRAPFVKEHWR
jgi:hypothetical protein